MPYQKRKSPREIIESSKNPRYEDAYFKFSGQETTQMPMIETGVHKGRLTLMEAEKLSDKYSKPYSLLHTHPSKSLDTPLNKILRIFGFTEKGYVSSVTPSPADLYTFLSQPKIKNMIIAQRDIKTGKVEGYFYARKPKGYTPNISRDEITDRMLNSNGTGYEPTSAVMEGLNLKYKTIPAEGDEYDSSRERFEKKSGIENKIQASIVSLSLIVSILFLSSNITGNAIGSLNQASSNFIGGFLFLFGLVGAFMYLRKKK
jgi:hypothetical protein